MEQPRVLAVGDAQLLQTAVEFHQAADAEDLMARVDYLGDAARRHQIAGSCSSSCAAVWRAQEWIQGQPHRPREE
jgi:hypothetical protein